MKRSGAMAAAATLVALIVAGCGGGDGAVTTVTQTKTVTVTTTTAPPVTTPTRTTTTTAPPAATPPATYEQALARVSAAAVRTVRRFESPSGNFYCDLRVVDGLGGCEFTRTTVKPHSDDACPEVADDGIGRLVIDKGEVFAQCITDTIRTTLDPPVLSYGVVARAPGTPMQCLSQRIGLTCIDIDHRVGFFVNTSGYRLL